MWLKIVFWVLIIFLVAFGLFLSLKYAESDYVKDITNPISGYQNMSIEYKLLLWSAPLWLDRTG